MATIIISGDALALAAEDALTMGGFTAKHTTSHFNGGDWVDFPTAPGECEAWARTVVQELYGPIFDAFWSGSAAETLNRFQQDRRYVLNASAPLSRGDLLYKSPALSGAAGHVGIMGLDGQVCENSSYHWVPTAHKPDARGSRSLTAFGPFSAIVRLSLHNKG